jgi:hypothetical protein
MDKGEHPFSGWIEAMKKINFSNGCKVAKGGGGFFASEQGRAP